MAETGAKTKAKTEVDAAAAAKNGAETNKAASASAELLGAGRRARGPWPRVVAVFSVAMSIPIFMAADQQRKSSRGLAGGAAETA
ncbi:hypothetical protein T492DRAFT_873988 [Pavlovales sp. CCMP2436]|nr:hypothetical protein T492DRAFT_873988 [Pavlovales sp. CCMP2436]